ncbi:MAG: hypothetical protein R3C45_12350 [Phycisphaerales bacterium]
MTSRTDVPEPRRIPRPRPEARPTAVLAELGHGLKLTHIIAEEVDRNETADAMNLIDLLRANVGFTVSVRLHDQEAWITGELVSMPTRYENPPIPYQPAVRSQIFPPPGQTSTDLMILKTAAGTLALQPNAVAQVKFEHADINQTVTNKTRESAIRFNADKGKGESNAVALRYLAQGIAWSPNYVVEMSTMATPARVQSRHRQRPDEYRRCRCRTDRRLPEPQVRLVPHRNGTDAPDGFARELATRRATGILRRDEQFELSCSNAPAFDGGYGGGTTARLHPHDLPAGGNAEDLYFYQVPGVTLAKGERGYFPLISTEVPAKHVYTWDIADFIDRNDRYQTQPDEVQQVVWHSSRLTNTTDQPWTTAPGMTVKDGRVLGQDTLNFTPPKGTSQLKITQAVSIDAQQNEVEIDRQRNAETFHGTTYDKVTVEGTLLITNYKDKPVTIKITKQLSGEVGTADGNPEVVKIASGLNRVNPRSKLTWETEAKPGKDNAVKLTYQYSFYTR